MQIGDMFGFGVGGGLFLAAGVIFFSWFSARGKSVKEIKNDVLHAFKQEEGQKKIESLEQELQEEGQKKIESLEQEQVKVEAKIKETEKISVEQQEAIREVVDRSSEMVQEILQEKNPSEIKRRFNNAFNKI